ncbi:MAG: hypothetical protein EBX52_05615 [Proteobacteria bacterium]|nr:hypothetical protein [Pseudomonadota bacterium]
MKKNTVFFTLLLSLLMTAAPALAEESSEESLEASALTPPGNDQPRIEQYLIKGEDAEALYIRLQKKEHVLDGKTERHTKIGQNVVCEMESSGRFSRHKNYQCAFSIRLPVGELHEEYPISEDDQKAGLKKKPEFIGHFLEIKKDQDMAVVSIRGLQAKTMFDGMSAAEEEAIIRNSEITKGQTNHGKEGDQNGTSIQLKTATHIRCFKTTDTIAQIWECNLVINSIDGKAQPTKNLGSK